MGKLETQHWCLPATTYLPQTCCCCKACDHRVRGEGPQASFSPAGSRLQWVRGPVLRLQVLLWGPQRQEPLADMGHCADTAASLPQTKLAQNGASPCVMRAFLCCSFPANWNLLKTLVSWYIHPISAIFLKARGWFQPWGDIRLGNHVNAFQKTLPINTFLAWEAIAVSLGYQR